MTVREHLHEVLKTLDEGVFEWDDVEHMRSEVKAAMNLLDASQPQCLDDPPLCSHRLVPDRQEPA